VKQDVAFRRNREQRKGCVSVIVPIYNEKEHVEKLLRAVTDSPVTKEIIVVDDGSTDGTRENLVSIAV
jgi:dolichol-phosphate mannosyltransferase